MSVAWILNFSDNGYDDFGGTWKDLLAPLTNPCATTNYDIGKLTTAIAR